MEGGWSSRSTLHAGPVEDRRNTVEAGMVVQVEPEGEDEG